MVIAKGADEDALLGLAFVLLLVPITLIDLDHRLIPNKLTLPGAVLAIAIVLLTDPDSLVENLISGAAAGGFLLVAALVYPAGMGMGDVKLAGMMGLYLGRAVAPAMFAALIAGTLVGALIIARKGAKEGRKTAIPFGPYLALGGLVGLFAGDELVDWYLDTFTRRCLRANVNGVWVGVAGCRTAHSSLSSVTAAQRPQVDNDPTRSPTSVPHPAPLTSGGAVPPVSEAGATAGVRTPPPMPQGGLRGCR